MQNNLKSRVALLVSALLLMMAGAVATSCVATVEAQQPAQSFDSELPVEAPQRATITCTVSVTIPRIVETTIIKTSGYAPIFNRPAPDIPHAYRLNLPHSGDELYDDGNPVCFTCHCIPQEHEFWAFDAEVCARCHKVTPTPTITPPYIVPVYR